jgi:hypothetical protein
MGTFSAIPNDLEDAVAYELDAIEYLRATLFKQSETPDGGGAASFTLGDITQDGVQRVNVFAHVISSVSEGAVRAALDRLRPLAFSAAFKMQDMIAEWILRANGVNDWQFSKKLDGYDKLRAGGRLSEPSLFAHRPLLARAFWELYRFFFPFRGTVVHSGGLVLRHDGAIEITRGTDKLCLTTVEQGSYMRAMCIITKSLLGRVNLDSFLDALIEGDFLQLEKYHGQKGFTVRNTRRATLSVNVPASHVISQRPLLVEIDFDHLRRTMERAYPVGADGRLYFSVAIIVHTDAGEAVWNLPIESVPSGLVTLREGDSTYDRFLRWTDGKHES